MLYEYLSSKLDIVAQTQLKFALARTKEYFLSQGISANHRCELAGTRLLFELWYYTRTNNPFTEAFLLQSYQRNPQEPDNPWILDTYAWLTTDKNHHYAVSPANGKENDLICGKMDDVLTQVADQTTAFLWPNTDALSACLSTAAVLVPQIVHLDTDPNWQALYNGYTIQAPRIIYRGGETILSHTCETFPE